MTNGLPLETPTIDPEMFAASTRALLDEDPRRYRNFGVYWYFVKGVLKRYYDRHNLYLLGSHDDPRLTALIPDGGEQDRLSAAADEYRQNASFNLGRPVVMDPDGVAFILLDPDAE